MKTKLWVVYDDSPAKLPIGIFDSAAEAAEFTGSPLATIQSTASRCKRGDRYAWRYARVVLEEDENEGT